MGDESDRLRKALLGLIAVLASLACYGQGYSHGIDRGEMNAMRWRVPDSAAAVDAVELPQRVVPRGARGRIDVPPDVAGALSSSVNDDRRNLACPVPARPSP
jgi:hypothetical protein